MVNSLLPYPDGKCYFIIFAGVTLGTTAHTSPSEVVCLALMGTLPSSCASISHRITKDSDLSKTNPKENKMLACREIELYLNVHVW